MTPAVVEREVGMQVAVGMPLAVSAILPASHMGMSDIEAHVHWPLLSQLPTKLTVSIPIANFKVSDLLALTLGEVVHSLWAKEEDVPVRIGAVLVSWSEFEVVEQHMAIRLTRLA